MSRARIVGCIAASAALVLTPIAAANAAAAAPAPVVARIHVPKFGAYDLAGGLGAVWLLTVDENSYSKLRRIDPATNHITATHVLDSSAAGFAIGDRSIWVSMYSDNQVERIGPRGHVLARINVGLQPQYIHLAFGSVWVSNHHGRSVTRIDPRTNRVIATVSAGDPHMFRNGPQAMSDDGRYLYIYSSNGSRPFERIDPRTDRPTRFAAPVNCGDLVAIAGSVWAGDCADTVSLEQLAPDTGAVAHTITLPNVPTWPTMTAYRGALWAGFDSAFDDQSGTPSGGTLDKINPRTGAVERHFTIGGDASAVRVAAGSLWVVDNTNGVVKRLMVTN